MGLRNDRRRIPDLYARVFAAGDVWLGSTKQLAEGVAALLHIQQLQKHSHIGRCEDAMAA